MKLKIMRLLFILTFSTVYVVTRKLRYKWILHYLLGSAENKRMPASLVDLNMVAKARGHRSVSKSKATGFQYMLHSSLLYEGSGFGGRPEAFYIVGGLTYDIEYKGNKVIISSEDVYDWHSDENGNYFTSPMNEKLVKVMGWLFGKEYFPTAGFPCYEAGISNKLWADLELVGAAPFTTKVKVELSSNQWRKVLRKNGLNKR